MGADLDEEAVAVGGGGACTASAKRTGRRIPACQWARSRRVAAAPVTVL
ncbi:MAG: hypothetical protein H6705_15555 [Myxococcales bacterium]|nr:hypothetical protein [Myxococcales bacterium]